ncbi:MAG: hypothetical protein GXY53_09630 [Desulfobulbus sp.]|nr:hypothetical protein [Desulfobulbus sp.]
MTAAHYIIHRINLEIEAPDEGEAVRLQDEAARIFHNWILPELEELLDRLVPPETVVRLDTLDLALDTLDAETFAKEFGSSVLDALEEKFEHVIGTALGKTGREPNEQHMVQPRIHAVPGKTDEESDEHPRVLTPGKRTFDTFLHFLETGQLPWWSRRTFDFLAEDTLDMLLVHIQQQRSEAASSLLALFMANISAVQRLLLQFPFTFVQRLIRLLVEPRTSGTHQKTRADHRIDTLLHSWAAHPEKLTPPVVVKETDKLRSLIRWLLSAQNEHPPASIQSAPLLSAASLGQLNSTEETVNRLQHKKTARRSRLSIKEADNFIADEEKRQSPETGEDAQQPPAPPKSAAEDGIYVDHAGLVLLHPFFEYFFQEFDLLHDQHFRDTEARNLAVHLLHFLATGQERPPEHTLTLEKFLCGLDPSDTVPRFIQLTPRMHKEADTLLRAAIGHWKILKNTSPAGLREGFLQRPGKLIVNTFENRLLVEPQSHDLLLNYLPWGLGIIKLPWLTAPLLVDWYS